MPKIFIIDFDSTFIQVETLEILASIALIHHPQKKERLELIHQLTEQAMNGQLSFEESLKERISLLQLNQTHILSAIDLIKNKITPSFLRNIEFFKQNAEKIYIFSGSFIEIVWPVVQDFGLLRNHVFANHFIYDFEGNILGFDPTNPLAQDQGKVKLANSLKLSEDVVIIGDGYNDYEIKASGLADTFIAFTENVTREPVIVSADAVVDSLEGMFLTYNIPYEQSATPQKVLLLENIHPDVGQFFRKMGFEVEILNKALTEEALLQKLVGVHILGIRSKTQIKEEIIKQCPDLIALGAFCIGTNQIALDACLKQGIAVFNAPFSNTRSVVELTLAEMILLIRQAAAMSNKLSKGNWHKSSQDAHEIRGKTLGIIGYGNIGSQLSIVAEALGMKVIFYDIVEKLALGNAYPCPTLDYLLMHSDIITVHVDGRKENKHLIGRKEFGLMKEKVIFLNLSRDFVVDEQALTQALASGKVAGAGIDVFNNEPFSAISSFQTPLQQFENVILTPHIGGNTIEAQQNIGDYVARNLYAYIKDGSSIGSVNLPQLTLPSIHSAQRILHIHHNVPGILSKINQLFAVHQINIEGQFLKTNDEIGYVITDISQKLSEKEIHQLHAIAHTIQVRVLDKT